MDLKLCRICGENTGTSYIFDENEKLDAKIMFCCSRVIISVGDGLPAYICKNCEEELAIAQQFINKCEATDRLLRSMAISDCKTISNVSNRYSEDNKPKIEVKLEATAFTDHEDHYQDLPEDYVLLEHKEEIDIKFETKLQTKQSNKKRPKYMDLDSLKCSLCGRQNSSPSALAIHMRNHTGETPFHCPSCDKKYKDQGNLKKHINRHHFSGERERNFICEHCGKGFFSKNDVKIHMRTHTGETPYVCTECPMRFTQIGALMRHKRRHTGDKPHICATCGKRFCTKEELKYHQRVHSDEKNYSCSICKVPFKYQNNLKKHMILHSAPNSFICNYCGKTFNQKGNLKMHIDRQHSEKSGHCNVCSKTVPNIEVHMWRHTGQRPLKCEHCMSSFFEMKTLARHINYRHKNPEKFKCSFEGCNMKFPAKAMLEFHTAKTHETGIPFPCDRCTRGFYRKNDLARHKIGTHKERLVH